MTSHRTICLTGARGGSGTSTVAAALALAAARHHSTELIAHDRDAMAALLGLPADDRDIPASVAPQLDLRADPGSASVVVIDAGDVSASVFSRPTRTVPPSWVGRLPEIGWPALLTGSLGAAFLAH